MAGVRYGSDTTKSAGRKEAATEGIELFPTQSAPGADPNDPLILNEANAVEHTAYMFSTKKKWWILTVVALCQTSMSEIIFIAFTDL